MLKDIALSVWRLTLVSQATLATRLARRCRSCVRSKLHWRDREAGRVITRGCLPPQKLAEISCYNYLRRWPATQVTLRKPI